MFQDFKNAVLISYEEKKAKRQLSDNLLHPTKARLKKECLLILKNRYLKKDDETIKAFFNPNGKFDNHEQSISKFELDGFKALQNFLLGQPDIRREETIKLLAWLIDFEPRPYVFGDTYNESEKPEVIVAEKKKLDSEIVIHKPKEIQKINSSPSQKPWGKFSLIAASLIFALALGVYSYIKIAEMDKDKIAANKNIFPDNESIQTMLAKNEEPPKSGRLKLDSKDCMYWTGDHYEPIACNQNIEGFDVVPADARKLKQLKRITRPDTLRKKDLSKTWYIKINKDSIEFYTDSGSYPLDTKKRLKKLTPYMFNKYPNGYNIYKRTQQLATR